MVMLAKSVAEGLDVQNIVAIVADTTDSVGGPMARAMVQRGAGARRECRGRPSAGSEDRLASARSRGLPRRPGNQSENGLHDPGKLGE